MAPRRAKATAKAPEPQRPAGGRPSKYDPAYCDLLVDHMGKGFTFKSFAAVVKVYPDTLRDWLGRHPEFDQAHRLGEAAAEVYYTRMLQTLGTGQLRRLVSETPVMADGKPVLDPATGRVLTDKVYEAARGNAASIIFLTKNICKWRDVQDQRHSGDPNNPIGKRVVVQTEEERRAELAMLRKRAEECGDD